MASGHSVRLDSESIAVAEALAAERHTDVDSVLADAARLGLDALAQRQFFEKRRREIAPVQPGEIEEIFRGLGDEPPLPGDELPEGYKRRA